MKTMRFGWMVAVLALSATGCGGDDADENTSALEVIGEYDDNFGGELLVTADEWNGSAIQDYDNDENVVYTQNPEDDEFNPSKFSKYVYTDIEDDSFYYCQVVFDAETLEDAQESDATADDSDPATTGCGGEFSWTQATRK
jgi:hypothetical protein